MLTARSRSSPAAVTPVVVVVLLETEPKEERDKRKGTKRKKRHKQSKGTHQYTGLMRVERRIGGLAGLEKGRG